MKVTIHLSDAYRDRVFVETGKRPDATMAVDFDPATLTPEQRTVLVTYENEMPISLYQRREIGNLTIYTASVVTRPDLRNVPILYDDVPHIDAILNQMAIMIEQKRRLEPQIAEATRIWNENRETERAQQRMIAEQRAEEARAEKERREQEKAERLAQAMRAASLIDWSEDGKAILNLQATLYQLATGERRGEWAKEVRGIDPTHTDGYMFVGVWVDGGVVEIDNADKVYLVKAQGAIWLIMLRGGKLEHDIHVADGKGWALLLRDRVKELLATLPKQEIVEIISVTDRERLVMKNAVTILERQGVIVTSDERNNPFALLRLYADVFYVRR